MTQTIQISEETIVKTPIKDIKKGDILAYENDTTKKVRILSIEFKDWNGKKAFFKTIELDDTMRVRTYQFIDADKEFNQVLGYESIEETSLRCESCNKLLGKATFKGLISLKCPKCKTVNEFTN